MSIVDLAKSCLLPLKPDDLPMILSDLHREVGHLATRRRLHGLPLWQEALLGCSCLYSLDTSNPEAFVPKVQHNIK